MGTQDITLVNDQTQGWPADAVDDDAPLRRGSLVGRYLVLEELGRGGMGIVYRAYDPKLDRALALKRLRNRSTPSDSPAHARLRREAQTLARLSDPNVVTIYDVGEDEAGLFIAMELVEGQDLAARLRDGPHPWPRVLPLLLAAGRGLAAAHRVGVVHRDFKPANVLLGDDGRVAVTDFGLARPDAEATAADSVSTGDAPVAHDPLLTAFGVRVGTPAYMAPEQHAGEPATAKTDQYAFCVALHEALHGRRPFEGDDAATLAAAKREGLRPDPAAPSVPLPIPERLRRVLARGLQPSPAARFESMDALLHRLDPGPRRRWGPTAAVAVVLTTVAVAGVARVGADDDPCARSDEALAEVWSPATALSLRQRLMEGDRPYAAHAAQSVPEALDAWASRWTAIHREVCEATWRRGEQPAAALDARMGCLDAGRRSLHATLAELSEGDPTVLEHATELALALPDPEPCRRLDPRIGVAPLETSDAGASDRMRTRLARLETMRRVGRGREALEEAEAMLREMGAGLGPESGASLHYTLGVLRDDAGDFGGAQQSLTEAARLARQRGDARQEAEAWIELTRVAGAHQHDATQGEQFGELALATIDAMGADPTLRAHALLELGEVAFRAGDDARTLHRWTEAEALRREHLGEHDVRVAQVQARLAGVDLRRGELSEARRRLEAVIERYEETFGPGHPRLAAPRGNLAFILSAQGEHDRALVQMREALELARQSRGPHHPQVAGGHDAVGHVLAQAGRPTEAEPEFVTAIELFERSLGPAHPAVATPLLGLGRARLALGRPGDAVAPLTRALERAEAADLPPVELADIRFALARAVKDDDPEHAARLARLALPVFEDQLPPDDDRWDEIQAWRTALDPGLPPP